MKRLSNVLKKYSPLPPIPVASNIQKRRKPSCKVNPEVARIFNSSAATATIRTTFPFLYLKNDGSRRPITIPAPKAVLRTRLCGTAAFVGEGWNEPKRSCTDHLANRHDLDKRSEKNTSYSLTFTKLSHKIWSTNS